MKCCFLLDSTDQIVKDQGSNVNKDELKWGGICNSQVVAPGETLVAACKLAGVRLLVRMEADSVSDRCIYGSK